METPATPQNDVTASILLPVLPKLLLFFGLLLVFLTPPIQSADEDSHLVRSVMVSEGKFGARTEGQVQGQDVPVSLVEYVDSHRHLISDPAARYPYRRWIADSYAPVDRETTKLHTYSAQALSPLYYMPQAVGIWVGKLIYTFVPAEFNWAAALYSARIGNLVAYILVFTLAIKAAPRFALVLGFLAATPMGVGLAASCSYDVTVILCAVGFFAAVMSAVEKHGRVSWSHYLLVIGLAFGLGHCKAVYAPVMLSLFLLLKPLGIRAFVRLAAFAGGAALMGVFVSTALFGLPADPALQAAIDGQVDYVVNHPLALPGLFVSSVLANAGNLFVTTLGNLGWLNANFPLPLLVCWFGVGIASVVGDGLSARIERPWLSALLVMGGALIGMFALFIAMYITWTSLTTGVGVPIVDSVQGRYLLPLIAYLMATGVFVVGGVLKPRVAISSLIAEWQLLITAFTLLMVVFMIVIRYWIAA